MTTTPTGRPRGRPSGSRNKPKSVGEFIDRVAAEPLQFTGKAPPRPGWGGPWSSMSPEERQAHSRKLVAARTGLSGQVPGKPRKATNREWTEAQSVARVEAAGIMRTLEEAGQVPDDPRAAEALEKAVVMLRLSTLPKDLASLGRLILDFTRPRPTRTDDVIVRRTMEDILDEMAEGETA